MGFYSDGLTVLDFFSSPPWLFFFPFLWDCKKLDVLLLAAGEDLI
jgi:hypothetical protein